MAGYGTPIRLIFDNPVAMAEFGYSGGMELMAESIAIGVDRSVGGSPMPFSGGKRFALDLNLSNSLIQIDGIFADDDMSRRVAVGAKATAQIDFGITFNDAVNFTSVSNLETITTSRLASIKSFRINDVSGTTYTITFSLTGTLGTISGSGTTRDIVVYNGSSTYIQASALATAFATAIGQASSNAITGVTSQSDFLGAGGVGNSKVTLTQSTVGSMSGGMSKQGREISGISSLTPYFTNFSGGYSSIPGKSAGDKVQDLYGILNNTARKGSAILGGIVIGAAAAAATVATGGAAGVAIGASVGAGGVGALTGGLISVKGDYPIGIQIPYNSMIQATDGDKYAVRNFLVPTGVSKTIADKMSDGNSNPASVEFDTGDNMTGIQGTVNSFTAVYDAGEQVYGFKLTFVPIDSIL
tara:strand:- start:12907 stop:14145 length:1239 start_codon:yes stop_codon:yes gene_type:complete